ncbi:ABC transporter permease [Virgibacillus sp. C22-A2]|uniref:ABC transporter permease n=1 Tax=Virgibacillus tibetensis TaxID=3042313 RepID=A0ABU6KC03_9BACI|nr:ABC transporter permease [Virgibacillus sp. C22-A2]
MHFITKILIFIKSNSMQLQRKWLSLPLLLLFPIIIVGLIVTILIALFSPSDKNVIQVGLIDADQTAETQMVVDLINESAQMGTYIQIHSMEESKAKTAIQMNELSSYIVLPEGITESLYQGHSSELAVIGNPSQPMQSRIIKELIDSVTRHIRASQANILTINHYAKALSIENEARNDLLFEQFQEFLFYTIGKDRVINELQITNQVTSSPIDYYAMASWFIVISIWLLAVYTFLYKENELRMKHRMKLYGVTDIQQIIARIIVTLVAVSILSAGSFAILQHVLDWDLYKYDFTRIGAVISLYSILLLLCLAIIETLIPSKKLRLLGQSLFTGGVLLISGAFIPVIYFPLKLQELLLYSFSNEGFRWLHEIILNNRLYADYTPLVLMNMVGLLLLIGLSLGKERLEE